MCAAHAVLEHSLKGYRKPGTPLVAEFPQLETVARLGYGTLEGARCTECRTADAKAALDAVPQDVPSDEIERRVYQYEHWGFFDPLPAGGWGPSWAAAARRRDVGKGRFNMSEHRWYRDSSLTFQDVPVWQFTYNEPGQSSGMSHYEGGESTVFTLDDKGRSPVVILYEERRLLRRRVQSRVEWTRGPVDSRRNEVADKWHDAVLRSLISGSVPRMWPRDESYIGIGPARIYEWLMYRE